MAPNKASTDRKRALCSVKDFIPVEAPLEDFRKEYLEGADDAKIAAEVGVAEEIVPFVECKMENKDDEDATTEKKTFKG